MTWASQAQHFLGVSFASAAQRNRDKKVRKKARDQAKKLLLLETDDNEGEDACKGERGS